MRRRRAALLIRREPKSSDARSATHVSQLPARQAREAAGLSHVASVFASTTERGALDRPSKDQSSCPREAAGDGMSARKSPAERAKVQPTPSLWAKPGEQYIISQQRSEYGSSRPSRVAQPFLNDFGTKCLLDAPEGIFSFGCPHFSRFCALLGSG